MWLADTIPLDSTLPAWSQAVGVTVLLTLLVAGFIRGWLVSGPAHRSELAERDRRIETLEAENREQTIFLRDQMAPLLARSQDVLVKILEERAWDERQRHQSPPTD